MQGGRIPQLTLERKPDTVVCVSLIIVFVQNDWKINSEINMGKVFHIL